MSSIKCEMARIIPRKYWSTLLCFIFFILFSVMLVFLYSGINVCTGVSSNDQTSRGRITTKDQSQWNEGEQFNVNDYGVPVEEYLLSVSKLMLLPIKQRLDELRSRKIKTVLYYHSAYGSHTYGFNYEEEHKQGQLPYFMRNCRRRDCFCTNQRDLIPIEEFDAIVFRSRLLTKKDIPKVRKSHQRYVLWEMESPSYLMSFQPRLWNGFFNWTYTYRTDSDFWEPWGVVKQIKPLDQDVDSLIYGAKLNHTNTKRKRYAIAWFVSNCHSKSGREKYINELRKYIHVDIYGKCGQLSCGRQMSAKCWKQVEDKYYFYFSGENSLCKDYITEKFFNALKRNIIPIAFGGTGDKDDYSFAPKHSFINSYEYDSPRALSIYLKKLIESPTEYAKYFWWKPYYNVWLGRWKKAHCEICNFLHNVKSKHTYKDLEEWWVGKAKCKKRFTTRF